MLVATSMSIWLWSKKEYTINWMKKNNNKAKAGTNFHFRITKILMVVWGLSTPNH